MPLAPGPGLHYPGAVKSQPGEVVLFRGHPSWLTLTPMLIKGAVLALVAGVLAGLASAVSGGHVLVAWVIVGVLAVFVLVLGLGQMRRMRTTYAITTRRLLIETGLFSRQLHEAHLHRIQNVNAMQSLPQRLFRIGTVRFDTAGEYGFDFYFYGVENPRRIVRTVDGALSGGILRDPDRDLRAALARGTR
jgi:uncharacterized membrane protein YdbT with pleckstrin-like domain